MTMYLIFSTQKLFWSLEFEKVNLVNRLFLASLRQNIYTVRLISQQFYFTDKSDGYSSHLSMVSLKKHN